MPSIQVGDHVRILRSNLPHLRNATATVKKIRMHDGTVLVQLQPKYAHCKLIHHEKIEGKLGRWFTTNRVQVTLGISQRTIKELIHETPKNRRHSKN